MTFLVAVFLVVFFAGCDGQMCGNDWMSFEGSCYAFVDEKVSWSTAMEICRSLRSDLVEIQSAAENSFVTAQLRAKHFNRAWMGAQDFLREGHWVYNSNQEPLTYSNWNRHQPDNLVGAEHGEDCALMDDHGHWDDYWCDNSYFAFTVCEYQSEGNVIG